MYDNLFIIIVFAAPSPPTISLVSELNSSAIRVRWNRPFMTNGIITSYTITYNVSGNISSEDVDYNGQQVTNYII